MIGWLVVLNVPSTARSFRDCTPIYCPLRRTWSSINTPFRLGIEHRAVAWQSLSIYLSSYNLYTLIIVIWEKVYCPVRDLEPATAVIPVAFSYRWANHVRQILLIPTKNYYSPPHYVILRDSYLPLLESGITHSVCYPCWLPANPAWVHGHWIGCCSSDLGEIECPVGDSKPATAIRRLSVWGTCVMAIRMYFHRNL